MNNILTKYHERKKGLRSSEFSISHTFSDEEETHLWIARDLVGDKLLPSKKSKVRQTIPNQEKSERGK